jgi:hypothetical protein
MENSRKELTQQNVVSTGMMQLLRNAHRQEIAYRRRKANLHRDETKEEQLRLSTLVAIEE